MPVLTWCRWKNRKHDNCYLNRHTLCGLSHLPLSSFSVSRENAISWHTAQWYHLNTDTFLLHSVQLSAHSTGGRGFWMEMLAQSDSCCQSSPVWSPSLLMIMPWAAGRKLLMILSEICKPLAYQLAEVHTVNFNLQIKHPE